MKRKTFRMLAYTRRIATGAVLALFLSTSLADDTAANADNEKGEEMLTDTAPRVGAYYYPWYHSGKTKDGLQKWRRAMRLHLKHPQKPKAGLYDSRDPAVIGEHISQSLRAGIDFWAVSWWGPRMHRMFEQKIWGHPDSAKLKYAMLYESMGRFGSFLNPDYGSWISDLAHLRENYFSDPRYLKIDGRPVLFVYLSREYFRKKGQRQLEKMRELFPEIYLVGDEVFFGVEADGTSSVEYLPKWAEKFDAVTAYDVYGQSLRPFGGTRKAIDFLAKNYAEAKRAGNSVGTAFIPCIAPGYNDRAVRNGHPGRARYFTDDEDSEEGDIFRAMIREAAIPNLDPSCGNIVMVTSFNEWMEDTQIEATAGTQPPSRKDQSRSGTFYTGGQIYNDYGYLYLDILREKLGEADVFR